LAYSDAGCLLKNKNYPYYKEHPTSTDCPIKSCPYYNDKANGVEKDLNWETNGCPLNGKCRYYDKIKNDASLLEKCPYSHASDESNFIVKQGNPHKCSHLAKAHAEKVIER
jgi:hypothetical protein